jgi:hypothetical protein
MIKNVLITYDVYNRHSEVKDEMKKLGYFDTIKNVTTGYTLPNTTLWKKSEELKTETVLLDLQNVIQNLNKGVALNNKIELEKAMAVEFTNWKAIEN